MNEFTIQKRIAEILTANGFMVVASEVQEGYKKPAIFVSVHPSEHEKLMCGMEQVTDTVEIKYIPAVETAAECIRISDKLIDIFYYSPFRVENNIFTVERIETDIEDYVLYVSFELTYEQPYAIAENYEETENVDMNLRMEAE